MLVFWERVSPSHVGKGGFAGPLRLSGVLGLGGGFLYMYQKVLCMRDLRGKKGELWLMAHIDRFYGANENKREVEMDMREMVDKVKKGEPIYGKSSLSPYMQGVASRNSRYSGVFLAIVPWFNFVNHEQASTTSMARFLTALTFR